MDTSQIFAWVVSLATGVYLIYFKAQVDKRQIEETRLDDEVERRLGETEKSVKTLEINSAARDAEIRSMRERTDDLKKQFADEFSKLDQKIDRLTDKIDKILEHKTAS